MSKTFADDSKSYGCSCTTIVAYTALILGFFAITLSAIVFFNWTNGSLNSPTVVALERKIALLEQRLSTQKIAPLPPRASRDEVKSMGGSAVTFSIPKGALGEYAMTAVQAPGNPTLMRLCCLAGQYQVCDGSTSSGGNLGVQFLLMGDEGHLMVRATSKAMIGAKCTFSWW